MSRKPAETPLMRQFLDIKEQHADAIVLFRLGDFYEMFFDDAVVAARQLDLTLTTRDKGKEDAVPMCGVPHHAARGYVAKLIELGHKVVIAEQVEDPKLAKGLVRRAVTRIVTPGVFLDEESLEPGVGRYVAAIVRGGAGEADNLLGLAYLDATTGEFRAATLRADALADELARVAPRELVASADDLASNVVARVQRRLRAATSPVVIPEADEARAALAEAGLPLPGEPAPARAPAPAAPGRRRARPAAPAAPTAAAPDAGEDARALALRAAAAVLRYAQATQPGGALPVVRLEVYETSDALGLDETAVADLELVETMLGKRKHGSLLEVLDHTATAPGARLLRRWLLFPLVDVAAIRRRQDAVAWLVERPEELAGLLAALREIADLERLAGRTTLGVATPRDLARLRDALARLPALAERLTRAAASSVELPPVLDVAPLVDPAVARLHARLAAALVDAPPTLLKDGAVIRDGVDAVIDECRRLADGGKEEILAIEVREREQSGIGSLKVRYNRVFGYYIEISKSQLGRVPAHYQRKQTVATGERYVTAELAELERKVQTAEATLAERELQRFTELVREAAAVAPELSAAGAALAVIDTCCSLGEAALRYGYTRPDVDDGLVLHIEDGRHPVIERLLRAGEFVPNDCHLDPGADQLLLITGPNMAGKSTFMRQIAHIVILAQLGSFVPARRATIGLCDRIFTRVGAADDLSAGDSTFMVEMRETAAILARATRRSLVVLDEVGRGTSTFDGVSIAWAVCEFLHDAIAARTLFATHYHELVALAESRPRVRNFSVAVREHHGTIVFLRHLVPGGASRSYGIEVARLAGLPRSVISRARQILGRLEGGASLGQSPQLSLLAHVAAPTPALSEVERRLREVDLDQTTPLEALAILAELRRLGA
ncbi:MAG: DNA mismatch repair protein MutS [Kofleriaceae bacterium]